MIEQLAAARDQLRRALDQYLNVCLFIDKSYVDGCLPESTVVSLMDGISEELSHAPSYEKTLHKARAVFASTRNRSARIVPMSRLPVDILVQIFQLVTIEQNCAEVGKCSEAKDRYPKYPGLLTRVCAHWHRVVVCTKDLWTHVDMPWHFSDNTIPLSHVEKRTVLSGGWPLDIHITESQIGNYRARTGLGAIARLFASISPRIRSLELNLEGHTRSWTRPQFPLGEGYSIILDTCLSNCRAETLTRLAISVPLENTPRRTGCYFLGASSSPQASPSVVKSPRGTVILLTLSDQGLENLFHRVTSLELRGCYPHWTSKAYHGLVELRLGTGVSISEGEFLKILSSSPKLRLLDFELSVTSSSPIDRKVAPVLLAELETLATRKRSIQELGQILRLIRPGSRPVGVVLDKASTPHLSSRDLSPFILSMARFLFPAKELTICMTGSFHYLQVIVLFRLAVHARVLVLNKLDLGSTTPDKYTSTKFKGPRPDYSLNDLYVVNTKICRDFLLRFIRVYRVRRLTINEDSKVTKGNDIVEKEQIHADVSHLGCTFNFTESHEPFPMKEWV